MGVDAAEDSADGPDQLRRIGKQFGARVHMIVELCRDTTEHPKPPWLARKRRYIAHLNTQRDAGSPDLGYLRVSLADKVHNVRATIGDIKRDGNDSVFDRFNSGKDHDEKKRNTVSYYADLALAYGRYDGADAGITFLAQELHDGATALGADEAPTLGQ